MADVTPLESFAILGVNNTGYTGAIAQSGSYLPWLNDNAGVEATWRGEIGALVNRDVIILDGYNEYVATFNLTENGLVVEENYQALRAIIVNAIND